MCVCSCVCVTITLSLTGICRDALIEQLMREIVELKEQRSADHELIASLRERMLQLEAEINDYKQIAEDACNVSTFYPWSIVHLIVSVNHSLQENLLLKRQIEDAQSENGAQSDAVEGGCGLKYESCFIGSTYVVL